MRFTAITAFLLLSSAPAIGETKTLTFPPENPQFSVAVGDSWNPEITSAGILSAHPTGAAFAVSIFPATATTAPGAVDEVLTEVQHRFTDVKPGELEHLTGKKGLKFLERHATGEDTQATGEDNGARLMLIAAFTIDGKSYFGLFQAGTPQATKRYSADVIAILKSIAPLKSGAGKGQPERGR